MAGGWKRPAGTTTFSDDYTGLSTTAHYRYRVMATNAGGRSGLAEAMDGAAGVLVKVASTADVNVLDWNPTSDGNTSWAVERSTDGGTTWTSRGDAVAAADAFTDARDAGAGATYAYRMAGRVDDGRVGLHAAIVPSASVDATR